VKNHSSNGNINRTEVPLEVTIKAASSVIEV